ncbi:MAG: S41 family peptidase [Fimbriiglobus sp.]|nr:S41 family peptidase [Fimbriiglobus sp.]
MSQRNLAWLIVVPAAVLLTGVMTYTAPPPEQDYKMVRTVVDVLAEVDKSYYRELTEAEKKKLVEDMINGGLHSLDPYSEYFNEERLKQFAQDNKGTFGGIGAYLGTDPKTGWLTIDSPMPDSPALEAGLQPGDIIVKIDGQPSDTLDVDAARSKIKGEPGTNVTLTLRRVGVKEPFDVALTRRVIQRHPVTGIRRRDDDPAKWDYFADPTDKIAVIRLSEFNEMSGKEMEAAVKEVVAAGAKGLVLDLRNNPGGLLRVAEQISDLFLAGGKIVLTRDRHDTGRDVKAKNDGAAWEDPGKLPMAVLLNGNSASAAEIVAAALQDNGRAVVVGERSYGKGSVQRSIESPDGKTALKLTTEIWLTPNGKRIHRSPTAKAEDEWGVKPDAGFEVKMTEDQLIQQLLHLREAEIGRKRPADSPKEEPSAEPGKAPKRGELPKLDPNFKDPVLEKALEYLRSKATARRLIGPREPA